MAKLTRALGLRMKSSGNLTIYTLILTVILLLTIHSHTSPVGLQPARLHPHPDCSSPRVRAEVLNPKFCVHRTGDVLRGLRPQHKCLDLACRLARSHLCYGRCLGGWLGNGGISLWEGPAPRLAKCGAIGPGSHLIGCRPFQRSVATPASRP